MNGRHWFEVQANNLFIFTEIFLLLSWDAWKNRILTRTRINSSLSVRCSLSLFRWNSSDSNFCLFGGRTPRGGAVPRRQLLNRLAGGDVSLLFIHSLGSFLWMTFVNESYVTPSSDWHLIPSNSNDLKLIKLRRCFYLQWRNIAHKFRKECSWSNKLFNRITIACCPPPPLVVGPEEEIVISAVPMEMKCCDPNQNVGRLSNAGRCDCICLQVAHCVYFGHKMFADRPVCFTDSRISSDFGSQKFK